jgi:hypothetical protein
MTRRTKLVEELRAYFTAKGRFLPYHEYIEQEDMPYRPQLVKRTVGTWTRLQNMIGEIAPIVEEPSKAPVKAVAPKKVAEEKKES